jgi:hypothetical protein
MESVTRAEFASGSRIISLPGTERTVVAQGGQEGRGLPAAVRDFGGEPEAAGRRSPQQRHVDLGPGLVDEN